MYNNNESSANLLGGRITADEVEQAEEGRGSGPTRSGVPPTSLGSIPTTGLGSTDAEQSIWSQSAHPIALFCLFLFRSLAIATYLLCGFFSSSYVFSTVIVVILLSLDFWTVRNVSGRVLVGLRFWNQVDEDGTSFWVFEHRSPDQPANVVDAKMFWIAMYAFPAAWVLLFFVGLLKFNVSFLPIVMLALVFNVTNTVGYTYADRDAKRRWATGMAAGGMLGSLGGVGGSLIGSMAQGAFSKMFG
ncbi:hypothetical protein P7C70_g78, partial [Phenoliferia sp. Uapishka_3]